MIVLSPDTSKVVLDIDQDSVCVRHPRYPKPKTLFISEPWRAWWHFGCVGAPYPPFSYSFLAESQWKAAQDGAREDPFTLSRIVERGEGVIRSSEPALFEPLKIVTYPTNPDVHERYRLEKEKAFEEEHTPSAIISRLAKVAQDSCIFRRIPTTSKLFDEMGGKSIYQTDLPVDSWLVGRLEGLVNLSNGIAKAFHK